MAQNLFALSANNNTSDGNKPLVSFRAGKCTFANNTVTPIPKKGLVQLTQTPDSLVHFQWKDRSSGAVEDDLIIFPEEAVFSKVKQGTTGRVFILKFKTSERKLFFWMQEPKDDKDKEYEEKMNQYINNPPVPGESTAGTDGVAHQQMQQQGPAASHQSSASEPPSTQAIATQSQTSAPEPRQERVIPAPSGSLNIADIDLSGILANYGVQPAGNQDISLLDILSPENLLPILSNNPTVVQRLSEHLPGQANDLPAIRELLYSAQFQQSISVFEQIVASGEGNELLQQFGVDPKSAGPFGILDIHGVLRALQQQFCKE
jgi:hypothetical protein